MFSALEEVVGEYILNIDKENLKIAALRGKIKLENVQLDGDLLGSHILGSMGLSGFGILSCWAKTVKITVPLKNLEKEPTRIEMRGCHLLCLPLLPSTAHKMFGAGSKSDPRCTLRTRAKRSKLARFEKSFMSGRIPGEGPVAKRILRAVREVERDQKKKLKKKNSQTIHSQEDEDLFDSLVSDLGDTETDDSLTTMSTDEEKSSKDPSNPNSSQNLPELPRDWKVKLREKILRNMEASMHDIHIRCEVSEGGLDFCHPDNFKKRKSNRTDSGLKYDQRAFAFGATLDNFIYRTANEKWEVGSHEKKKPTAEKDHLGPNHYDARNNKLITWENFCMYWNDTPPFLISETEIIRSSDHKLSADKFHSKIAAAMTLLYRQQEPGKKIRESLELSGKKRSGTSQAFDEKPHQYCFEGFDYQVRQKLSDRTEPGPVSCQAEFLPFMWDIKFRPHQFVQYQKLKSAMLSQQRFDTMLRQRPGQSPLETPREWWKYAFSCVTTRPNSRPWNDVKRVARSRDKYIALVLEKMSRVSESSGFHGGLSDAQSVELLALEDLLPIEALTAFHLIALRQFITPGGIDGRTKEDKIPESPSRGRGIGRPKLGRIFRSRSKSRKDDIPFAPAIATVKPLIPPVAPPNKLGNSMSLVEAMTVRLGRKMWKTHFKFFHARVSITLLSASDKEIVKLIAEMGGNIRYFGQGKMDYYFDVTRFEVVDCQTVSSEKGKILVVQAAVEDNIPDDLSLDLTLTSSFAGADIHAVTSFMDLPPAGVVCRLAASKERGSTKLSFSAHPATLMWTRPCFNALAEFFGAPSTEMQTELTLHLKNASTPLARKAQLAFLSQSTLLLHINVAAPKVWVPFTSRGSDGALCLDAGNLRMSCTKQDGQTNMNWNLDASDIQVSFAQWRLSEVKERISSATPFAVIEPSNQPFPSNHGVNSIIRPFQVHAASGVKEWKHSNDALIDETSKYTGPVRCVDINISPICLNLVDAEILAREIGRWYSQGVVSVRGRVLSRPKPQEKRSEDADIVSRLSTDDNESSNTSFRSQNSMPHSLSVSVEKIEMALEGHSKWNFPDEKSIESHETSLLGGEYSYPTRTYVVEVFRITARRSQHNGLKATRFLVADASIVQLKDPSEYIPMKDRHEAFESQYSILERGNGNAGQQGDLAPDHSEQSPRGGSEVLRASLFHDGGVHLDEVEIDIDSIILRVTPTSLKDCTKGIKKIIELIQLMTREMERKVHEEGRKARQSHRDGKVVGCFVPQFHLISLTLTYSENSEDHHSGHTRPVSPAFSTGSELTSELHRPEETKSPSDSSLLFKVTIRDGTLLVGRPTSNKNPNSNRKVPRYRQSYSFAVVQVSSNALIMFQSIENPDSSGHKTLHISLDNLSASVNTAFDRIPTTQMPPMIGPTGAEFRAVYLTENLGCVVSHDVSLDCEYLKSCLTPNDLSILVSIVNTMLRRLRGVQDDLGQPLTQQPEEHRRTRKAVSSLLRYQKQGTGIATSIRVEFQTVSFVVLRAYQSKYGAPEFLAFNLKELKARLGGCLSALSGECTAGISVDFFNAEVSAWEYAVEPFPFTLSVDQMPNELVSNTSISWDSRKTWH